METCTAPEGCDRTDIVGYDGFCRKHYQRKWTHGDPSVVLPHYTSTAICSECDRSARALGYCTKHYHRFHVHGDPNIVGKVGNNGSQRKYTLNHDYFREIDSPEKAYWLGFLAADGGIAGDDRHGRCLSLELAEYDVGHLLKFAHAIGSDAPISGPRRGCLRMRFHSSRLADSLIALGVEQRKTLTVIPPLGQLAGLESYYWRGLWDGDGTISGRSDRRAGWTIGIVGSFACVDAFGSWARAISGSAARPNNKTSKNPDCWQWSVGGTGKPRLLAEELRLGGAGQGLDRKQVLLEELCAFDLDAHKARLNAGRAAAMRDAWATGRHPRAMKT